MTTLDRVLIVTGIAVLTGAWVMVAVSAWKLRRGSGEAWRRCLRGFVMIAAGASLTEARLPFRLPHEFTAGYVAVGGVGVAIASFGSVVVVRAHRRDDRR